MLDIIEYMKQLEVLKSTEKKKNNTKTDKEKVKKTNKSQTKSGKSQKNDEEFFLIGK